jgi:serine protease AprX
LSRPATARRSVANGMVGALLGASVLAAAPVGGVLQAVVSHDGPLRSTAGVHVVATLNALHLSVVRGDAAALARLAQAPGVRGIAPDDAVQLSGGRDDDHPGGGVLASAGLGGDAGTAGAGEGVRVALVDTGVSDTDALNRASGRLVDAVDVSSGEQHTGGTYDDGYGHGTFMADLVAGGPIDGTDGTAIGVAPAATVLVVRVAKDDGSTSLSKVLGGLDWIASHADQVDIASLSLSHARPQQAYGPDPLTAAVEAVRSAGVTVVVSSGNKRGTVGDPGFDPKVLTVGAADLDTGRVASFSGSDVVQGMRKPEVVASGVDVLGLLPEGSVLETDPATRHLAHGLFRGSGTSQATAITSGLAALFLAAHPSATPTQVKASLVCAAQDLRGRHDSAGLVRATTAICSDPDGQALDGSGDATGEVGFDASSWAASSWAGSSWTASSWAGSSWTASSWAGSSWTASSWAGSSWAASSWAASSWAASAWAASSWAASSWAGDTWGNA